MSSQNNHHNNSLKDSHNNINDVIRSNFETHVGNATPSQINMMTVSFPITTEQRQTISESTYRARNSRRNSSMIDKQAKKRMNSQKDSNNSVIFTIANTTKKNEKQKTLDSICDNSSIIECNLI